MKTFMAKCRNVSAFIVLANINFVCALAWVNLITYVLPWVNKFVLECIYRINTSLFRSCSMAKENVTDLKELFEKVC